MNKINKKGRAVRSLVLALLLCTTSLFSCSLFADRSDNNTDTSADTQQVTEQKTETESESQTEEATETQEVTQAETETETELETETETEEVTEVETEPFENKDIVGATQEQIADLKQKIQATLDTETVNDDHSSYGKVVYLTFDDGPSARTPEILDVLAKYNVKATFFVNSKSTTYYGDYYKRIVEEGHAIGNHTATHQWASVYGNEYSFLKEVYDLQTKVYGLTGVYPQLFRFPGGSTTTRCDDELKSVIIADLKEIGLKYHDWNIDSGDTRANTVSCDIIKSQSTSVGDRKKVVILMHDLPAKTTTVEALPYIIETLTEQGYTFLPLNSSVEPIMRRTK